MKVLTESELRMILKKENTDKIVVNSNVIVTPSAREYLNEKNIELIFEDKVKDIKVKSDPKNEEKREENIFKPKYISKDTGGYFENKPENMTQLYGNELVFKDHCNIVFRGKIDSLESKILEVQVIADKNKSKKLVKELQEVLQYVRNILRSEVVNEKIENITLFGLREEEIREMSHNPKKHIGVDHILPEYKMGEEVIGLNYIRSNVREAEISSIHLGRPDIIKALNRLSSAVYVMMCRYLAGYYNQ
ncbi:cobalamin adenosyltransferase [Clostridium sp. D2Q-11]|uniref:Cobalamin adenosyltransferase n=1 Tax=Anaeromonas frigoriresistens TaxID=2683708 RepID=A0A942Z6R0_9FIRM|nr:cobalamin adenosyltransferase [Anaeromonas frigoriresistens]MBS4537847.1 cobalamin adenosyltransferase [Anaeromonas frigoriresistens]